MLHAPDDTPLRVTAVSSLHALDVAAKHHVVIASGVQAWSALWPPEAIQSISDASAFRQAYRRYLFGQTSTLGALVAQHRQSPVAVVLCGEGATVAMASVLEEVLVAFAPC